MQDRGERTAARPAGAGTDARVTVIAGGVGGARLLAGLARHVAPGRLAAICNVGDDFTWHGLHVSPDIDTVIYTLAGREGPAGWGLAGDGSRVRDALAALGGETWMAIGDDDLATHLRRTAMLQEGRTLGEATAALAAARGVGVRVLPVTNDPHPTRIVTTAGEDLAFQVYFVQRGTRDAVREIRLPGAADARPAPGVLEAIAQADVLCIAPSNPFVSVDPVLAVPGVRDAVRETTARRIAVSPIVGGAAVKGPAAAMLRALGHEVSALAVARRYAGLVDVFALDAVDAALAPAVESLGLRAAVLDTMMVDADARGRVAAGVLAAAGVPVDA